MKLTYLKSMIANEIHVQELELYKKLSHKHVVGYIDSQLDEKKSMLYIFLEYGERGRWARSVVAIKNELLFLTLDGI